MKKGRAAKSSTLDDWILKAQQNVKDWHKNLLAKGSVETAQERLQSLPDEFKAKVHIEPVSGCWIWLGSKVTFKNAVYGQCSVPNQRRTSLAHRYAFTLLGGIIPEGLELDHLCRTSICCNPDHLEPVTHSENMRRAFLIHKPKCLRGHDLVEGNLSKSKVHPNQRICLQCTRERHHRCYAKRKSATAELA